MAYVCVCFSWPFVGPSGGFHSRHVASETYCVSSGTLKYHFLSCAWVALGLDDHLPHGQEEDYGIQ